jgi:hypothetical protein
MKRSQGSYYDMAGEQKTQTLGAKAKGECEYKERAIVLVEVEDRKCRGPHRVARHRFTDDQQDIRRK